MEEYHVNADALREQAILRAATAVIQVGKNDDGTIWTEGIYDPEAALKEKRETGGDTQIYWKQIDFNLRWNRISGTNTLDSVGQVIDYFASEYAQYKTRIEQQYTGDEQAEALAKLEELFSERVAESADEFSRLVGDFLEANGVEGEHDAIRNSFLDIYEQRKTTYLGFIEDHPDYAGVKGTEDEWLLTAGNFMGEQLRYAMISQQPEMSEASEYGYSMDDLYVAGTLVKELARFQSPTWSYNRSEEELGVELGVGAMKYALLSNCFDLSDDVKSKLDQAFNNLMNNAIDNANKYIDQQRSDPFVRNKEAYTMKIDKTAVMDIIKQMVENLNAKDVNAAFRSNLTTYMSIYKQKMQVGQTSSLARYHSYYSSWMNQNFASEWNPFVDRISAGTAVDMSRYLLKEQMQWLDITV